MSMPMYIVARLVVVVIDNWHLRPLNKAIVQLCMINSVICNSLEVFTVGGNTPPPTNEKDELVISTSYNKSLVKTKDNAS